MNSGKCMGYNLLHPKYGKEKSAGRVLPRRLKNIKKKGFSLVELLMALLVASLLMAALAPVMTRKMEEHVSVSALASNNTGYKIFTPDDADCEDVEGQNYKKCTFKTPNDVHSINIYMQGAGGGGAAATKGVNKSCAYDTKTGNISQSQDCMPILACTPLFEHKIPCKEVLIEEGLVNFKSIVIGPGGGGGGAVGRIECNNTNHKYLTSAQNGNNGAACVTKYNVGESRSAAVSVTILPHTTNCTGTNCCWRTSSTEGCNNTKNWEYSGCGRVVCTYDAGANACSNYSPKGS